MYVGGVKDEEDLEGNEIGALKKKSIQ